MLLTLDRTDDPPLTILQILLVLEVLVRREKNIK